MKLGYPRIEYPSTQAAKANRFGPTVHTTRNFAYSFDDHARSRYRPAYNKTTNPEANYPLPYILFRGGTEMILS